MSEMAKSVLVLMIAHDAYFVISTRLRVFDTTTL